MEKIGSKSYSKKELIDVLEIAKASQEKLNAVVTFYDDIEAQLERETADSVFKGVPIALKDNISTKGVKTTASSKMLDNYIPIYDATVVKKLKEAGAVFIAKTSMDELGMGGTNLSAYTGPVSNPYNLASISGGSSGGSAALVASGIVPFALGTDTGDSIRKPASFCGIVGFKPSYGRISRYGVIPYASSLDHVGYFTRNVEDAAKALSVVAGRDDLDMTSSNNPVEDYYSLLKGDLRNKKIAVFTNVVDVISNQEIVSQFNELMDKLVEAGAIVEKVTLPEALVRTVFPVYNIISNCEATANHSNLDGIRFGLQEAGEDIEEVMTRSRTEGFSWFVRRRFIIGGYALKAENQDKLLRKSQKVRRLLVEQLQNILKEYDVLVAPASGQTAPLKDQKTNNVLTDEYLIAENHMVLGNFTGYPSITIPMGFVDKMPVGINLTSRAFSESLLLDISYGIESIVGLKDLVKEDF